MAISNKMSILGTKKAVMAYNGGYYLPSVSDEGILSWSPTVEGMAPIPEVNVRGPQGPQGSDASVTAEAIQAVVPIAFGAWTTAPSAESGSNSLSIGDNAHSSFHSLAIGSNVSATGGGSTAIGRTNETRGLYGLAVGYTNRANASYAISIGNGCAADYEKSISIGSGCVTFKTRALTLGANFTETVDGTNVTHTCTTEGTGSITIGAGANTLNTTTTVDGVETTVESSNSVTIGCKAENKGADSVVIGASAKNPSSGNVLIGAGTRVGHETYRDTVAIGKSAAVANFGVGVGCSANGGVQSVSVGYSASTQPFSVAVGCYSNAAAGEAASFGYRAKANAHHTIAIGSHATVSDYGATVIRSTASDGTYTQLYFSGANTPLANTYANGEGIMGYVTTDSEGNMVASGFKRLSALFDEGSMTQPAILNEDGEWEQPKVFKPSDVDMEVEEPSEPEEYQPLPVYPIVEPEIPEIEEV